MTERSGDTVGLPPLRDQLARTIAKAVWECDATTTGRPYDDAADAVLVLLRPYLTPPGVTPEKLRAIAQNMDVDGWSDETVAELRAWADALGDGTRDDADEEPQAKMERVRAAIAGMFYGEHATDHAWLLLRHFERNGFELVPARVRLPVHDPEAK